MNMNGLLVLRKSAASLSSKRSTLTPLQSLLLLHRNHFSSSESASNDRVFTRNAPFGVETNNYFYTSQQPLAWLTRSFHVSASGSRLDFRASDVSSNAEYAFADLSDEPKLGTKDDGGGLEISKLGISEHIVSALAGKGITKLFPIQRAVLEPAMQGRDMIGRARTGTGKTLAFGIPIMDKIIKFNDKHGRGRNPLALILAPTRELARQVDKEFAESAPILDALCVYGGVPIGRQMGQLDHGVDVVVGTPGRIIDLIKRGALNLSEVQFVVLDEADQMLNVGFAEDVETILENLPQKRQTMMFSATMPSWILKLIHKYLKSPLTIDLVGDSDQKLPEGISLYTIASEMRERQSIIGPLITEHAKGGKCIVFTQTKRDADRLAYAMQRNFKCEALHGDISQSQRERTLSGFRDGLFNILVATDVAARGLDVPNVDLIIHYELPNTSEIFVHRSGRTGRAGKKGSAILIYSSQQTRDVRGIERDVGCKFTELPRIAVEGGIGELGVGGSRFGSFASMGGGRFGDSGSNRSGGYGSGFGRSNGYGGPSGRTGGFGESGSDRFGSYGGSGSGRSGGGFGGSGQNRSGKFGGSGTGRQDGFGDLGSSGRSGGFGDFGSGRSGGFGDFGSGRSRGFGDFRSNQTGGESGETTVSHFGGFGDDKANQRTGRKDF